MSQIYEHENQMIVRFPKDIAKKIREQMLLDESNQQVIKAQPYLDTQSVMVPESLDQDQPKHIKQSQSLKFQINIPFLNYQGIGNLVELPTTTESYKSKDFINLFKSNDINQMIWIEGKSEGEKMHGVRKVHESHPCGIYQTKLVYDHGLTPPTYDVRKDCHRKQPLIPQNEVQRIEKELDEIQKQFMQQTQGNVDNQDESMDPIGESKSILQEAKKRQRKKYNKF